MLISLGMGTAKETPIASNSSDVSQELGQQLQE